jgi:hypothetical protein
MGLIDKVLTTRKVPELEEAPPFSITTRISFLRATIVDYTWMKTTRTLNPQYKDKDTSHLRRKMNLKIKTPNPNCLRQ